MGGQISIWSRLLIKRHFNRRAFLKASLLGAFVLGSSRSGFAQYMTSQKYPSSNLTLYNTHTSEKLTTTYRTPDGDYDAEALKSINWILRCHYTNEVANMDVRVLNFLNMVDNQLGGTTRYTLSPATVPLNTTICFGGKVAEWLSTVFILKEKQLILSFLLLIFPLCVKQPWHSARGVSATTRKPGLSISIAENCAHGKEHACSGALSGLSYFYA